MDQAAVNKTSDEPRDFAFGMAKQVNDTGGCYWLIAEAPQGMNRQQDGNLLHPLRAGFVWKGLTEALLQTWGTAARRHPVGGLGSIGEMLIEHNHGFGQGRGSNSECSFNQAHLPHDTWLQAPCLGLSFA